MASGSGENQATNVEFKHFNVVPEASDHHYRMSKQSKSLSKVDSFAYRKIMKEWRSLERDLPESIYVQVYETRIDLLRAVIIGAEGTPYHNGLFFFDICLPSDYPFRPPKVYYHSHGLDLNPNLYADGTVCLSLLNTWYGAKTEKWNQNSTILQVLVSIQGLVLNDRPYFNEPGYERGKNYNCPKWMKQVVTYNEKIPSIMAYQDFSLLVGASEIKASITFKWNLRSMHSKLKKVFDTISKPNIKNSEKLENVKKEMKPYMFQIDSIVPNLLDLKGMNSCIGEVSASLLADPFNSSEIFEAASLGKAFTIALEFSAY
ncbi:unnamed protein product [Fraxinus pennsylvanica]|uniref:UBC core domain-containing protein n=1 Tax=Fraxinus pennsylvanica TaxID=56036 RepID=A0AAD1ZKL4_9LAMI|nr:unnamed protein product [Fraxinus pennsylvanica]